MGHIHGSRVSRDGLQGQRYGHAELCESRSQKYTDLKECKKQPSGKVLMLLLAVTGSHAAGAKSRFGTVLSMDLCRAVRGAWASGHHSLHYDRVRFWRNSVRGFSGLLAVAGQSMNFSGAQSWEFICCL